MIYLARIQMRLVLDLSVVYDLRLDPEDPEDVLMVFGYALGVAPTQVLATGAGKAAGEVTKRTVRKYVSKDVLKAVQSFARKLGFKILQRTILKYAVPVVSAAVGGGYNYVTTKSIGEIARSHFKSRSRFASELRALVSNRDTYDLVFPAAALHVARLDGDLSSKERDLYRIMRSWMAFPEHTQAEFDKLAASEASLAEAAARIEDPGLRHSLLDVLVLMAICDGELTGQERVFLTNFAGRLSVPLDLSAVEERTRVNRNAARRGTPERAMSSVRDAATMAGGRAKSALATVLKRRTRDCPNCEREIPSRHHAFCPNCGTTSASSRDATA
jgi:tellurite resistance protein